VPEPGIDADLERLAAQLLDVAEQLTDLALDRLRLALDEDDPVAAASTAMLERRITRARRSVERAAALLTAPPGPV